MKPKVTIGVCVKNCANFVKDTIDSIITQDFIVRHKELRSENG